ncbi:MAG: hypothetical protein K8H85_05625 [Cyclobacteriaceae bacterium]|nr:hypothetical protein [Cyclobacteriaceae bacterium]
MKPNTTVMKPDGIKIKTVAVLIALIFSLEMNAQMITDKMVDIGQMQSKDLNKAPKKMFIKNFKVYYQMIAEAEKTIQGGRQFGGGSYTGDATARLAVGVEGIEPEQLQQLTNRLYNDYVAKLKNLGMEVYTSKDYTNLESFEGDELLDGPRINEEQIEGSLMVVPDGFSYYVKRVTKKGKEKGGFMSNMASNEAASEFSSSLAFKGLPKLSMELDDMIVVDVAVNVPSMYMDKKAALGTVKIKGGAYLRIENARATYASGKLKKPGVATPDKYIELMLKEPIKINGVFAEQEFKSQAKKQTTSVPSYSSYFSVGNSKMELSNTIKCNSEDYTREVGKAVTEFLDFSIDKLKVGLNGEKVK